MQQNPEKGNNHSTNKEQHQQMPNEQNEKNSISFPLIVIGASAGGLEAMKVLIAGLPKNLGAAVLIVWHMSPNVKGVLPAVLNRLDTLPASHAYNGAPIQENHIYVAPPDHHLLVEGNLLRTTKGPKENRFRPAVDPLFRSAAYACGQQLIGIVLSGALDDGTSGLWMIKNRGGIAVVQDPLDAEMPSMPQNAMRSVMVDYCIPVKEMPQLLVNLVKELMITPKNIIMDEDEKTGIELRIAADENIINTGVLSLGALSPFTCPECHGVLTAIIEGNHQRFRCHTGHAFSTDSLLAALTEHIEESIWSSLRSIKESTMLMNHIGDHFAENNDAKIAALYFRKAQEAEQRARKIREVITQHEQLREDTIAQEAAEEKNN